MKLVTATLTLGICLLPSTMALASEAETHDGFHMQLSLGLGHYSASAEALGTEVEFSGMTFASGILLGGTPFPGLVIGGGLILDQASSPTYTVNGQEGQLPGDISQYVVGLGPYVDFYPDPKEGLHFQVFPGWGGLETSSDGNAGGSDPTGLVLSMGVGYDWFIGDQWSAGVMGRFIYAPLSLNGQDYTVTEPALVGAITYH